MIASAPSPTTTAAQAHTGWPLSKITAAASMGRTQPLRLQPPQPHSAQAATATARWTSPVPPKPKPRPLPIIDVSPDPRPLLRPQPAIRAQAQPQLQRHVPQTLRPEPLDAPDAPNIRPPRRRALLIGIRYVGTRTELSGPWNDLARVYWYITQECPKSYRYLKENIVVLKDDPKSDVRAHPTRYNMLTAMNWLVCDAQAGDSFFFYFCGHGSRSSRDAKGVVHETIAPMDYSAGGSVADDELYSRLVAPLGSGCRLTCVVDCCHSGNMLSLPCLYSMVGKLKEPGVIQEKEVSDQFTKLLHAYEQDDLDGVARDVLRMLEDARQLKERARVVRNRRPMALVVRCYS